MDFSNGMILLCSGVFLLILSFILLAVFFHIEKKKKKALGIGLETNRDTTAILHNNNEVGFTGTELLDDEGTETIPLEDDKTEMINS